MIPMLLTYNFVSNMLRKATRYTEDVLSSFIDYFTGLTYDWYLLNNGPVPVVPAPVYRKGDVSHISWVYNTSYNILAASHSNERSMRLPFLSAAIVSNELVYPIDDFLEEFHVIHPDSGRGLTPREIVLCWEIYNRTWLENAVLKVIDTNGEEHSVDGFGEGGDAWTALLYPENEEEEDTEEEEGEETEEEEGEEEEEEEEEEEGEESRTELLHTEQETGGVAGVLPSNTPVAERLHTEQETGDVEAS
jgi:hypothetical protein